MRCNFSSAAIRVVIAALLVALGIGHGTDNKVIIKSATVKGTQKEGAGVMNVKRHLLFLP